MRVLRRKILVVADHPPKHSDGGIAIIPGDKLDYDRYGTHTGTVTALGPEVLDIEIGDRLMFTNHEDMHVEDEQYMVIYEADVIGIMEIDELSLH